MGYVVMERASLVLAARERLALCPPHSPAWRGLATASEAAWQDLVIATGLRSAAIVALRHAHEARTR
jgi:hypothetical protein